MDESLEMLQHLWRDQPFEFAGKHYRSRKIADLMPPAPPPPVQQPRIPTWVVGALAAAEVDAAGRTAGRLAAELRADLRRVRSQASCRPQLLAEGVAWLREERAAHGLTMDGYDVVAEGTTSADDPKAAETVRPWAEAGATWWIDADWSSMDPPPSAPAPNAA